MQLEGKVSDLLASTGGVADLKFFTMAGVHTQDKKYNVVYTVERSPAPVDILTFTAVDDANCTFELRNDTSKSTTFFKKFLNRVQKVQSNLDSFFAGTVDDFTGKFSLWRPPTW
jgi:RIO-like serine/threonine protein kinase